MSPDPLRDRLDIADLLQRYFVALDEQDYALLDDVFVPGARLHYEMSPGAPASSWPEMLPAFREFNQRFRLTQHMMGHPGIELDGDTARSRTSLRALHVQETRDGRRQSWVVYGLYRDHHVRTDAGWRVRDRHFRCLHTEGELLPPDRLA